MADSKPRNFISMPIDTPMHHTQSSAPGHKLLPPNCLSPLRPRRRAGRKPWHTCGASGVFGAITIKWYSKMTAPRAILVDGSSCRKMGMVLSKAGDRDWGRCVRWNQATNWGETTWCICEPCARRDRPVRTSSQA